MDFWKDVLVELVHISLLTAPMIGLVLVIHWAFGRKLSGRLTYGLWLLVLVRMLVPVGIPSPLSFENVAPEVFEVFYEGDEIASDLAENEVITYGSLNKEIYNYPTSFDRLMSVLTYVWLFGIFVVMFFPIISYITLKRAIEEDESAIHVSHGDIAYEARKLAGVERMVVKYSYYLDAPALIGVFRPMIILPANMKEVEEDKLLKILLHEMIHYRRQHLTFQWIFWLVKAVYWFNPLLWIGHEWMKLDGEFACDEEVIMLLGEDEIGDYGHVLLDLSEGSEKSPYAINAAGLINRDSELKRRIVRLGRGLRTSKVLSILTVLAMVVILPVFFTVQAREYDSFENYVLEGLLDFEPMVEDDMELDLLGFSFNSYTGELLVDFHYRFGEDFVASFEDVEAISLNFGLYFPKSYDPEIRTESRGERVGLDFAPGESSFAQGEFQLAFSVEKYDVKAFGDPVVVYEGGEIDIMSHQVFVFNEEAKGRSFAVDDNLNFVLVETDFGANNGCSFGLEVDMKGDYDIYFREKMELLDGQGNTIKINGYGGEESENYMGYDVDTATSLVNVEEVVYEIDGYTIRLGNWVYSTRYDNPSSWEFSIENE